MRLLLTFIACVACRVATAADGDAYVIIDAEVENYPPATWIAFQTRYPSRTVHIPAVGVISAIPPGNYYVSHVDFTKTVSVRNHTALHLRQHEKHYVSLAPGTVNFIGTLRYEDRTPFGQWSVLSDMRLLARACAVDAKLIDGAVIYFPGQAIQPVRGKCDSK